MDWFLNVSSLLGRQWPVAYITFMQTTHQRTSDGGNGNHNVSLPIILIKNKVDQKFPSS